MLNLSWRQASRLGAEAPKPYHRSTATPPAQFCDSQTGSAFFIDSPVTQDEKAAQTPYCCWKILYPVHFLPLAPLLSSCLAFCPSLPYTGRFCNSHQTLWRKHAYIIHSSNSSPILSIMFWNV